MSDCKCRCCAAVFLTNARQLALVQAACYNGTRELLELNHHTDASLCLAAGVDMWSTSQDQVNLPPPPPTPPFPPLPLLLIIVLLVGLQCLPVPPVRLRQRRRHVQQVTRMPNSQPKTFNKTAALLLLPLQATCFQGRRWSASRPCTPIGGWCDGKAPSLVLFWVACFG